MRTTTNYSRFLPDGRLECTLCPRACALKDQQQGMCFMRGRQGDEIELLFYGATSGACIDPIEKKPLNHFLPGTSVLSLGTLGCNLACKYCQNWDISKSRSPERMIEKVEPAAVAYTAKRLGCGSVAFTYNDPVIFMEYAIDTARECRALGIKTVSVSAGYMLAQPRAELYQMIDAANIDLKGFTEEFYRTYCSGHLQPVLETLEYLVNKTSVWTEITTLLIPGANESPSEIQSLCEWIGKHLGPEIPLHFTAFHPSHRMLDRPPTDPKTLSMAREIALKVGLKHVYIGNVRNEHGATTYCAACGEELIKRDGYDITQWSLESGGACPACGKVCAGLFERAHGIWGNRRQSVQLTL